jgi:inner membrane protein
MDTLTHALAGALIGETATRTAQGGLPPGARRGLFVSLMVAGSNLPDMDFLYSLATGSKLDYLLHHRGHTHTIFGALLASLLMYGVCAAWIRWRKWNATRSDRRWLAGLALLAPILHMAMDSTNTYGIHPFWPFNKQWFYGDSVFIVEPTFWAAAMPLFFVLKSRLARVVAGGIAVAVGAWIFSTGMLPLLVGAVLIALVLAMLAVGYFAPPRVALIAGMFVWAAATFGFIAAHAQAREDVEAFTAQHYPGVKTLDHALSPMPVNPICWEVVLAQVNGASYAVRRAMMSIAPDWIAAEKCPYRRMNDGTTVPLAKVLDSGGLGWKWYGEYLMPLEQLPQLADVRCEVAAFLRFSRVPWALERHDGWVVGDLRYDREPQLGFSELELPLNDVRCPAHMPDWTPPRADLLQ